MRELIVLGVPATFPCLMAALSSLPAAQEQQMDWIRVSKDGHTCDFAVPKLEALVKKAATDPTAFQPPKSLMWTTKEHEAEGNIIEPRVPVWQGLQFT